MYNTHIIELSKNTTILLLVYGGLMIGYLENEKFVNQGVVYPFKTHIQSTDGPSQIVDVHYHHHIEILYCLSGDYRLFRGGMTEYIGQGDLVVINAMESHAVMSLSEGKNEYIVIRFEPEMLYTSLHSIFEAKYLLPFTVQQQSHQRLFRAMDLKETGLPELIIEISKEDALRNYGFELAIRTHLGRLFLWILRHWHGKGLELTSGDAINYTTIARLRSALDYVAKHYDEAISVSDMATMCHMSYSYFSRIFKQVVGQSFSDYVNFVRLSRAEHFLMSSQMSITEVALCVGYTTTSYFIDLFKKTHHMTPLQFRKSFSGYVPQKTVELSYPVK
jgi:AraC-like DNA-binding protein/mannose-6-phosphate isomerase-like protein (cupin superfamily)